jgi:hypothetical protein
MQKTETVLSVIRDHPKTITGEPVTGKLVRRVREGADGKGPVLRAPHRRPTSLGGGPHGKGPEITGTSPCGLPYPGNQWSCPGVRGEVLGDPRDMAKAELPES